MQKSLDVEHGIAALHKIDDTRRHSAQHRHPSQCRHFAWHRRCAQNRRYSATHCTAATPVATSAHRIASTLYTESTILGDTLHSIDARRNVGTLHRIDAVHSIGKHSACRKLHWSRGGASRILFKIVVYLTPYLLASPPDIILKSSLSVLFWLVLFCQGLKVYYNKNVIIVID